MRVVEWRDVAVFAPVAAVVTAGLRVLAVAGNDETVLRYLVRTLDVPALLIATVIAAVPVLLLSTSLILFFLRPAALESAPWLVRNGFFALRLALLVTAIWVADLVSLLVSMLGLIAFAALRRRSEPGRSAAVVLTAVAAGTWILFVLLSPMWLPPERIVLRGQDTPHVVYVLDDSGEELLTLDATEHTIRYVDPGDVHDRVPCNEVTGQNRVPGRTLSWYLGSLFNLPKATSPRCG
nr:hypothetical protein [uncultured Actinoplanes sp.]